MVSPQLYIRLTRNQSVNSSFKSRRGTNIFTSRGWRFKYFYIERGDKHFEDRDVSEAKQFWGKRISFCQEPEFLGPIGPKILIQWWQLINYGIFLIAGLTVRIRPSNNLLCYMLGCIHSEKTNCHRRGKKNAVPILCKKIRLHPQKTRKNDFNWLPLIFFLSGEVN